MGHWKELGVVPDSDDEGFDSEDSLSLPTCPRPTPPNPRVDHNDKIWDFPSSPVYPRRTSPEIGLQSSSKSTTRPQPITSTILARDASQSWAQQHESPVALEAGDGGDPSNRERDSPDPLADLFPGTTRDQVSPSIVQITATSVDPFPGSPEPSLSAQSTRAPEKESRVEPPTKKKLGVGRLAAKDSPPPARRSLRPRKPIQEHPYLLEDARYSRFMKTHGFKPVKIANESQSVANHSNEEDSQDPEYTSNESQMTLGGLPGQESQGLQRKISDNPLGDEDELALSPSPRTSSPRRMLRASSQPSQEEQTDNTSIGDEDFPDIRDLAYKKSKDPTKPSKRRVPSEPPTSRKQLKTKHDMSSRNSPCHPPIVSPPRDFSDPTHVPPRFLSGRTEGLVPASPPKQLSPPPGTDSSAGPVDLTHSAGSSEPENEHGAEPNGSSSDSDSEVIRRTRRTIRGVLPASWLRLDQQARKDTTRGYLRRQSPPRSPDQPRRGLAVTRHATSRWTTSATSFLNNLSDDDDHDTTVRNNEQSDDDVENRLPSGNLVIGGVEDDGFAIEEDHVDWMLPGQKRSRASSRGPPSKRKKTKQNLFKGQNSQRYRQPKISNIIHRLARSSGGATKPRRHGRSVQPVTRPVRAVSPPALSIVDVVGPHAPKFIKVAVRAASRRKGMGRSKPSQKSIDLGNRTDNIDALSVLRDWKKGKIRPRAPQSRQPRDHVQTNLPCPRQPFRELSNNVRRHAEPKTGISFAHPRKLAKQVSIDKFVVSSDGAEGAEGHVARPTATKTPKSHLSNDDYTMRPAQLEADMLHHTGYAAFATKKKMLDLRFRKGDKEILASPFQPQQPTLDQDFANGWLATLNSGFKKQSQESGQLEVPRRKVSTRPRPRKPLPRRLDIEGPKFKHANDPLPFFDTLDIEGHSEPSQPEQSKISGLGPFGTQYAQHFDIFPLPEDTFFHHSTILGDGTLKQALEYRVFDKIDHPRGVSCFNILNHQFQWGHWTETTSSEIGLLFDVLSESMPSSGGTETDMGSHQAIRCADHILKYMLHSVSIDQESSLRSFIQRLLELLLNFLRQMQSAPTGQQRCRVLLEVTSRFLICALLLLRICQSAAELFREALQAEEVITRYATLSIGKLLDIGLSDIRATCDDLRHLSIRERGIRSDSPINCWVIVIKVLGSAQIPRAGFWDLTSSVMATTDILRTSNAQRFEELWRNIFTLLPLGEFDDTGVLSKGMRHVAPLQGWILPQKLLNRVLESYQTNPRQSPSFNEYLRALIGRCYHLIEQWGWFKCSGIIGTIFDFFGRQNLSHLRNEEVYKSPRFLEDLSGTPSLSIETEDRCFHVFLKMLAVAIQNMGRRGLFKDIRNLIARSLPNHNRQYSKEQEIYAHDLAALRNHHDLLCTLFWSAPPEERPAVHLIEKLVLPASSHKEACLINLRAWNQLARFMMSSGASVDAYRPFMAWQTKVFNQVLEEYISAAADVQRQFMSLSKEERAGFGQERLDRIVSTNRTAAKDVLYFSVVASLDVMKHCSSLASAMFSFNTSQMNKIFAKLNVAGADLDWGILRTCFETIDHFVKRLEELQDKLREESSNDSVSSGDSRAFEDAVEFLDDKVVQGFFATTRRALSFPELDAAFNPAYPSVIVEKAIPELDAAFNPAYPSVIVEKAIILCGRITSIFINGGKCQLKHFFCAGKYGLFEALPDELNLKDRRFIPLFVATLLKNHVFDFSSIGCSLFDVWMSSLVKPFHALRYETYLAETLKTLEMGYLRRAVVITGANSDYNVNRDLFACGISYMRQDLRQANFAQRKPLRAKYERLLKLVMQQMRSDIKSLTLGSEEHKHYISFIREIVALIKSHGSDICPVDPFYYQVGAEYSPAKEDPQLHIAGIIAYGLRLGEGEATAIPQLFYYLYNHFKLSLASGHLDAESKIIENSMKDDNIFAFVLGLMLPAIIRASLQSSDVWPLLSVYFRALRDLLGRSYLPREIPDNSLDKVLALLYAILSWLRHIKESSTLTACMSPAQTHILTYLVGICNAVRPSLMCWLLQPSLDPNRRLLKRIDQITMVAKETAAFLGKLGASRENELSVHEVPIRELLAGLPTNDPFPPAPSSTNSHVDAFTQHLVREVRRDWVVTADAITVKVAITSTQSGTQSTSGVKNDLGTRVGLFSQRLHDELKSWVHEMGEEEKHQRGRPRRRTRRHVQGEML